MTKKIIAMGGGGFSMEPDNPLLDQFVIECTGKTAPKICFLGTASAENTDYKLNFYRAFIRLGCRPDHLSLFMQPQKDLRAFLLDFDAIYVGGGNTRCMLALWREWNLDEILREAWEAGIILAGISAGAICWFEQGITDSVPGELTAMNCLGFLAGSCCPHYDSEVERRPTFQHMVASGQVKPGFALDDGAAVHYIGDDLAEIVSSRPGAGAYRLSASAGQAQEELLPIRYLG
jgi:dipeptidase E